MRDSIRQRLARASLRLNTYLIFLMSCMNTISRIKSNPKNAINEHFLPRFLDFIVWGHEHECLVEPTVSYKTFLVSVD